MGYEKGEKADMFFFQFPLRTRRVDQWNQFRCFFIHEESNLNNFSPWASSLRHRTDGDGDHGEHRSPSDIILNAIIPCSAGTLRNPDSTSSFCVFVYLLSVRPLGEIPKLDFLASGWKTNRRGSTCPCCPAADRCFISASGSGCVFILL